LENLRRSFANDPDPALAEKIKDLRSMFFDAYTGWLEIEDKAA
jgi:hypothetical protein